jgi:hypothetical protein
MRTSPKDQFVELHRYADVSPLGNAVEVVECPAFDNAKEAAEWKRAVCSERASTNVHFFRQDGPRFQWWPTGNVAEVESPESLSAFYADLVLRRLVTADEPVELLRQSGDFKELARVARNAFPPPAVEQVWTPKGLEAGIAREAKDTLPRLARQMRSRLGVLPFVGAGMSAAFGLPQWREFLEGLAERIVDSSDLAKLRAESNLESFADELWTLDPDAFQNAIEATFDLSVAPERLRSGALATLAQLIDGPVITTNFDHVLEDAFEAAGRPFSGFVHGARPDSIVRAIHQDLRHLLKIHGDCRDRTLRTFTLLEYERNYSDAKTEATLTSLGWLMFTQRPLLFLGSSLESDRTVEVLKSIHLQLRGVTHFAILGAKYRNSELVKRRRELGALGVAPLWFRPGDFEHIERYLTELLELMNSRELREAPARSPISASASVRKADDSMLDGHSDADPSTTTRRIARAVVDGRVAFLLGNYAHLGAIRSGDAFYEEMRVHFGAPALMRDRSEVARYVLDRTTLAELFDWYRGFIDADRVKPSALIRTLAELPRFLRKTERPGAAGVTFLTTNYDLVLERALEAAGEPFHWFYYLSDENAFAYRSPDGAERIVERPDRFQTPRDAHVCVVKLNGGLVHAQAIPHSVCIAPNDFARLAARLPACLPAGVRSRLETRSLLCLGHGLYELDVEQLIRHVHSLSRRVSWAVQKVPLEYQEDFIARRDYWNPVGLELVEQDLTQFTTEFAAALRASRPVSGNPPLAG